MRREQRAWYWYDWANSAYVTTTMTVLIGPYLTAIAKEAACPGIADGARCDVDLHVLGIPVSPGSLVFYTATASTIISAFLLVFVGAIADRTEHPTRLLGGFAWVGSAAAALMFFLAGTNWQLGVLLLVIANLCLGASLVVYDALLIKIATPDERDRVSSRGWAFGYLGGGLLLLLNLVLLNLADKLGISTGTAVRISLLSAGLWWGVFTLIPYLGLRTVQNSPQELGEGVASGTLASSFTQLARTLRELRGFPQTMQFLIAYLFFNDGIQTVINASAVYGSEELGFTSTQLVEVILLVQFVAFFGALLFGRLAGRYGAWRTVLNSLVAWTVIVAIAYVVPKGKFLIFLALAVGIGLVLGGSQALSRSLFSQLVPRNREAEFFSLYQAMERGTSWFGTLLFGLVQQLTHSYRAAILALVVFFVLGGLLLSRVRMREGIIAAGNEVPAVI